MDVSFIIPAHNEAATIVDVIYSIQTNMGNLPFTYEVIIVDNASTDDTVELVRNTFLWNSSINVALTPKDYNVSAVRNKGASLALGSVLIFLDADVVLDRNWNPSFRDIFPEVLNEKLVTGSVVGVPDTSNWIINHYFKPIVNTSRNYINSGHLIVSKFNFFQIGAFDADLETGEDSEFSMRAKAKGYRVETNKLPVTHLGFPKTLSDFFKRERWHGKGNWTMAGWHKMKIFIILFWLGLIVGIVFWPILAVPFGLGVLMGIKRCGFTRHLLPCIYLSWTILAARGLSLIDVMHERG